MKHGSNTKLFKNGLAIVKESYGAYTECFKEYIGIAARYLDCDEFDKELNQNEKDDFEIWRFLLDADRWLKRNPRSIPISQERCGK